ncbi:MAG: hypothetical protein OXC12_12380 [Spirochaetaceae bacterium]|nr:hypothetical protein [Spirochaetaceae bacterium]
MAAFVRGFSWFMRSPEVGGNAVLNVLDAARQGIGATTASGRHRAREDALGEQHCVGKIWPEKFPKFSLTLREYRIDIRDR